MKTQKEIKMDSIVTFYSSKSIQVDSIYYDLMNENVIVNYFSPNNGERLNATYNIETKNMYNQLNKGFKKSDKWFKKQTLVEEVVYRTIGRP
jgi:hypothetical protein